MRCGSVETYEFLRCHCERCENCSSTGFEETKFADERRFMRYVEKSPSTVVDLVIDGVARQSWANGGRSKSLRLGDLLLLSSRAKYACAGFSCW
jgi:hypothetical protein